MNAVRDPFPRLLTLEQILAHTVAIHVGASDPSRAREEQVQRIRRLTAELQHGGGSENDEVDALAFRVLLNDYVLLAARLREAANEAEKHLAAAHTSVKAARRRFDRLEKHRLRQAARTST